MATKFYWQQKLQWQLKAQFALKAQNVSLAVWASYGLVNKMGKNVGLPLKLAKKIKIATKP